ncbi:MAG: YbaB/EbfC family nucleoid-associated protein [Clostridia bacterium]|nr:YbaB/EbfC family nucleoid-associated protein [Clostridia bacterium]
MAGFGNMGNMQQLMRQAKKMQEELQEKQEELNETEITGSVAGGMVEVIMYGDKTLKSIKIKPEAVDPDDIEMLEDLIISAFNDAIEQVDELKEELFGNMPQGLGF